MVLVGLEKKKRVEGLLAKLERSGVTGEGELRGSDGRADCRAVEDFGGS
jgi:hypothetical protein